MDDLKQINYEPFVFEFEKTEYLNEDEKQFLITEFKELFHAYQSYQELEQVRNSCFFIVKSCLTSICKTLNTSCSFCEDYMKEVDNNLMIANQIKEKEEELGKLITKEILSNGYKKIEHNLNQQHRS